MWCCIYTHISSRGSFGLVCCYPRAGAGVEPVWVRPAAGLLRAAPGPALRRPQRQQPHRLPRRQRRRPHGQGPGLGAVGPHRGRVHRWGPGAQSEHCPMTPSAQGRWSAGWPRCCTTTWPAASPGSKTSSSMLEADKRGKSELLFQLLWLFIWFMKLLYLI